MMTFSSCPTCHARVQSACTCKRDWSRIPAEEQDPPAYLTGCASCGSRDPSACPCTRKERAAAYQLMMDGREVTAFDRAAMDYVISRTKAPERGIGWHLLFLGFLLGVAASATSLHFVLESTNLCLK